MYSFYLLLVLLLQIRYNLALEIDPNGVIEMQQWNEPEIFAANWGSSPTWSKIIEGDADYEYPAVLDIAHMCYNWYEVFDSSYFKVCFHSIGCSTNIKKQT